MDIDRYYIGYTYERRVFSILFDTIWINHLFSSSNSVPRSSFCLASSSLEVALIFQQHPSLCDVPFSEQTLLRDLLGHSRGNWREYCMIFIEHCYKTQFRNVLVDKGCDHHYYILEKVYSSH